MGTLNFGAGADERGEYTWDLDSYWAVTIGDMWGPRSLWGQIDALDEAGVEQYLLDCERKAIEAAGGTDGDQPSEWDELRAGARAAIMAERDYYAPRRDEWEG